MAATDLQIQKFLVKHLGSESFKIFNLAGDASTRRYYRIVLDSQSWVLMNWEPFDVKKYPFISVLSHFKESGVRVPSIVTYSEQDGLVLLEDLGDLTLERKFWESQQQQSSMVFYEMAIDEMVKIHVNSTENKKECTAFNIQFDTDKFLWEMNYGKDNLLLGVLKFQMNTSVAAELQKVFLDICQRLDKEPKRIAHRDYHSRNLMIKLDQMIVIDFQDARLGPVQYDLVSLLKDSYVDLNEESTQHLINNYLDKTKAFLPKNFSRENFDLIYELQSVQRCFKACGSFASFYHQREDRRYLKYLNGTLKRVLKGLTYFPEYKAFAEILMDSGALAKKYELL
jgi:aminoglycoside/choline kinase family phosphotransferase